jgi:hypothetical protein
VRSKGSEEGRYFRREMAVVQVVVCGDVCSMWRNVGIVTYCNKPVTYLQFKHYTSCRNRQNCLQILISEHAEHAIAVLHTVVFYK